MVLKEEIEPESFAGVRKVSLNWRSRAACPLWVMSVAVHQGLTTIHVCFAPEATEFLHRREMSRRANRRLARYRDRSTYREGHSSYYGSHNVRESVVRSPKDRGKQWPRHIGWSAIGRFPTPQHERSTASSVALPCSLLAGASSPAVSLPRLINSASKSTP